jgi:hypothetical protein
MEIKYHLWYAHQWNFLLPQTMFVWKKFKHHQHRPLGADHHLHMVEMEMSKIRMCKRPLTYFCHESCQWMNGIWTWMDESKLLVFKTPPPCSSFLKLKKELVNGVSWAADFFFLSIQKRPWSPPRGPPKGQTKTIANHLDQLLWWANQKHWAAVVVRSYLLHSFLLSTSLLGHSPATANCTIMHGQNHFPNVFWFFFIQF